MQKSKSKRLTRGQKAWKTRRRNAKKAVLETALKAAAAKPTILTALKTQREITLETAIRLTTGDRNRSYGDPLPNFRLAATLSDVFWSAFVLASIDLQSDDGDAAFEAMRRVDRLGRHTAHGQAIDLIFTKLSRIASNPTASILDDQYTDIAGYAALAREVAGRS